VVVLSGAIGSTLPYGALVQNFLVRDAPGCLAEVTDAVISSAEVLVVFDTRLPPRLRALASGTEQHRRDADH
jgi:hypothetical protein